MIIQEGYANLEHNCIRQLQSYWGEFNTSIIVDSMGVALKRLEAILSGLNQNNKYVWKNNDVCFSPYHSVQYSFFLWLLSNTIYKTYGSVKEADMIYYLNKIMHSCDWYYAIEFPKLVYADHLIGSVMGRAQYGDRFFFYQGCTVGGNRNKEGEIQYPVIGNDVIMYANTSILGKCNVGNHVILSADCTILNEDIPDNCIVFGKSPNLVVIQKTYEEIQKMQGHIWQ